MVKTAKLRAALRRPRTWIIAVPVALIALALVVPFVYTHYLVGGDNPEPLSFEQLSTSSASAPKPAVAESTAAAAPPPVAAPPAAPIPPAAGSVPPPAPNAVVPPPAPPRSTVAGTWSVGSGTEARYGIDDTLLGQTTRVVGRTNSVSGTAAIDGLTVTSARVVVNMQSVHCSCMHDPMYHNMLETPKYPSSVFTLTSPIVLPNEPAAGAVITVPVTGTFSIHGNTRQVSFQLQATRIGATRFAVKGSIPVDLSDYDIRQPESGPVARVHNPSMELLIAFDKSN